MMYCEKHCFWHECHRCPKCLVNLPPYLRTRDEVADPREWRIFVRRRWVK